VYCLALLQTLSIGLSSKWNFGTKIIDEEKRIARKKIFKSIIYAHP